MSVAELVSALHGLQTDGAHRAEYNEWLQTFQRGAAAWQTTYEVLSTGAGAGAGHGQAREVKIFAAQTLRHKVARDLHQVPAGERLALKDSLVGLLEKNTDLVQVVGVQLCLALAALAMQTPEWDDVVPEMTRQLAAPEYLPALLEFLKVLPEEFSGSRPSLLVDPASRQTRARAVVGDAAYDVLNFLVERAPTLSAQPAMRSLFFEALEPWLLEIPVTEVVRSPVLDWVLEALRGDDTGDAAADCLLSLLDEARDVREPEVQPAIEQLYARLLQLRPLSAHYADDSTLHSNLTRVFARAGENWHPLLVEQPAAFLPLLEAIADCVLVPDGDLDAVEYTFQFFDDLRLTFDTRGFADYDSDGPDRSETRPHAAAIATFRPTFLRLLSGFLTMLQYPEGKDNGGTFSAVDLFGGDREEEEKFRAFRYDIGDMIKVCTAVLGSDAALSTCADRLDELLAPNGGATPRGTWQQIEAVLFCVRTMVRVIPDDNKVLPRIFAAYPKLPGHEKVYHSALLILGSYSKWAAAHEDFIEFELKYILDGVMSSFYEVRRAAAQAFMFVGIDCAPQLVPATAQLLAFYNDISGRLDLESFSKIGDGLGHILAQLDVSAQAEALQSIFTPVAERAAAILRDGVAGTDAVGRVGNDISALAGIVEALRPGDGPAPLVGQVQAVHGVFVAVLDKFGGADTRVAAGVTHYYVFVVRFCRLAVGAQIPALAAALARLASSSPRDRFFELTGNIAQVFNENELQHAGRDAGTNLGSLREQQELVDGVWKLSETVVAAFLRAFDAVSALDKADAGLLESGFHLLCDAVIAFRPQFLFSTVFAPSVQAAVKALALDETQVLAAVASYLEELLYAPPPGGDPVFEESARARITSEIKSVGATLVYQEFYGYIYNYDSDFEPRADKLLALVFEQVPAEALAWVQSALDSLPAGNVSPEEKVAALERLVQHFAGRNFAAGAGVVRRFAKAYVDRHIAPRT